jgi:hypothetical protein
MSIDIDFRGAKSLFGGKHNHGQSSAFLQIEMDRAILSLTSGVVKNCPLYCANVTVVAQGQ